MSESGAGAPAAAGEAIALGADHGGFRLKESLAAWLRDSGYRVLDCGTSGPESVDYPDFAHAVARRVADGECRFGVVVDGAGIGSAMVANKVPGVRAALCYDLSSARNSREHNHANVLTLGAGLIGEGLARQIVEAWLATPWGPDRHARRAAMIDEVERRYLRSGEPGAAAAGPAAPAASPAPLAILRPRAAGGGYESMSDSEQLVHAVTRKVLAALAGTSGDRCTDCLGACAASCGEKVRQVVAAGAGRVSYRGNGAEVPADLARFIDHTLLKPDATAADVDRLCDEARQYRFAAVCVNPVWVRRAARRLTGSEVTVASVVGFPLGATTPQVKAFEARRALREGAREIDMVVNVGALKGGDRELVERDVAGVSDACHEVGAINKVILETALLTDEEKVVACRLALAGRADYVKTSTGFGPGGATVYDVALMREAVGPALGVKASGGIRSAGEAHQMIAAGATRIGASAGVAMVSEGGSR